MDHLFISSNKKKIHERGHEELYTLQNLSPQKYGKAAYANLTYTPSKLADNVLFKDATNQKKIEQETSKLRQTQTLNSIFQDRLIQLQQQKQGIQKTLNQQISMYKKMLKQKQQKNQKRIKQIQQSFNTQIKQLLNKKQQQAKFAQSQKQLLQSRINQLQNQNSELKNQLAEYGNNHQGLKGEYEKLKIQYQNITKSSQQAQIAARKIQQKQKQQLQSLKRHLYQNGLEWEKKLQKEIINKNKQLQNLQRLHRNQLQKIQNKRVQQLLLKNQQIKDLANTFQKQTARLNGIINKKEQQIIQVNKAIQTEKQRSFNCSKGYQNEITMLNHAKSCLKQQLLKAQRKLQKLTLDHSQLQQKYQSIKANSQSQISHLQKDLQMNQIHYIRQIDQVRYSLDESTKQIVRLKLQNQQVTTFKEENIKLNQQVAFMKQLLMESSDQMDKCKEEFLRINNQRNMLSMRLRQLGMENQALYMIKSSKQQQARGWKQSYFIRTKARY